MWIRRRLWKVVWLLPKNGKIRSVKSLLVPIFSYDCIIFGNFYLRVYLKRNINVAFNSCTMFALGLCEKLPHQIKMYLFVRYRTSLLFFCTTIDFITQTWQNEYIFQSSSSSRSGSYNRFYLIEEAHFGIVGDYSKVGH